MKHFSRQEWLAFAKGQVEEKKNLKMEKHLLVCNKCLAEYLSFISPPDEAFANRNISPNFTADVMKSINALESRRYAKRRDLFYYTAAACLTFILMSSGVFQIFVKKIPEIAQAENRPEQFLEKRETSRIPFGWSDRLLDNTLTLLDILKPNGDEEGAD
jgi:hypothetical protein